MHLKLIVFLLIIVESVIFTKGDHIVSRERRMNTISKSKFNAYGRERIRYGVGKLNNTYKRVPKRLSTRKTSTQRGRMPKLNTRRNDVQRVPHLVRYKAISRLKLNGHIKNGKLSDKFNRRRFRGILRFPKTKRLPIRRRPIPILNERSKLINIERKGLNKILRQPIKTTGLDVGPILKWSKQRDNVKTMLSNTNASSDTHRHTEPIESFSMSTNNSTTSSNHQVNWNYNTSRSRVIKTYAIPGAKSIRSPEIYTVVTQAPQPINTLIPPKGRIEQKHIPIPIHTLIAPKPLNTLIPPKGRIEIKHIPKPFETKQPMIHSAASVTKAEIKPVTQSIIVNITEVKQDASSFMTLLNNRRPKTRNELDEQMIRNHLLTLDAMRDVNPNKNNVLIRQMQYIKTIAEFNIQREVLKLLVKDIIDKSGIMNNDWKRADVPTLVNLITNVNKITDEFANPTKAAVKTLNATNVTSKTVKMSSADTRTQGKSIGSKIQNALGGFRSINVHHNSVKDSRADQKGKSKLNNFKRVTRRQPIRQGTPTHDVGTSIDGKPLQKLETPVIVPLGIKRVDEPVGGDLGYWTHLSAGLADMLCSLCRKQSLDACIQRFCTDVRAITESPIPI